MNVRVPTRRALFSSAAAATLWGPAAAQSVAARAGIAPSDLPNLTIREVKAYDQS